MELTINPTIVALAKERAKTRRCTPAWSCCSNKRHVCSKCGRQVQKSNGVTRHRQFPTSSYSHLAKKRMVWIHISRDGRASIRVQSERYKAWKLRHRKIGKNVATQRSTPASSLAARKSGTRCPSRVVECLDRVSQDVIELRKTNHRKYDKACYESKVIRTTLPHEFCALQ